MAAARPFRDLKLYQAARDAAKRVFVVSGHFPREERYALIDQIRRGSRAVKAMLADYRGVAPGVKEDSPFTDH
jgi:23S rRNA-intervening sequence protein